MEPTPADHRAADIHKCFVDVIAFVKTRTQASELMKQRDALLDDIAIDSQAAAVRRSTAGDRGEDAAA